MSDKLSRSAPRFGIGEWFGYTYDQLSPKQREDFAAHVNSPKRARAFRPCPFQGLKTSANCSKESGVCSLRQYEATETSGGSTFARPVSGGEGALRATCPLRFHEGLTIFRWIGKTLIGDPEPNLVGEVGFLEGSPTLNSGGGDDVGRIDMVLVSSKTIEGAPIEWCAVEIQAVYFSGDAMGRDFKAILENSAESVLFQRVGGIILAH